MSTSEVNLDDDSGRTVVMDPDDGGRVRLSR
jgi:hypothetical protein